MNKLEQIRSEMDEIRMKAAVWPADKQKLHGRADELVQAALIALGEKELSDAYADACAHFWYS